MILQEAQKLCKEIRATGLICRVPKQFAVKDEFCALIHTIYGDLLFYRRDQWESWLEERVRRRESLQMSRPKSPIDAMIDAACGVKQSDYK